MKGKGLLVAFLLAVGLCFVPGVGHGEVPDWAPELKADKIDVRLLEGIVRYIMFNPESFLVITCTHDDLGLFAEYYPAGASTQGKINIMIKDNRQRFSRKYGRALLNEFKIELEEIYYLVEPVATDMDSDVVALFCRHEGKPLGYFYQGEYHLWER